MAFIDWLYETLRSIADGRKPDFVIGNNYCRRWWIIPRNRFFNIYLHQFLHSDEDRALHDHPWWNVSWLLHGTYREWLPDRFHQYHAGNLRFRSASMPHRIELTDGECWSLFITGPVIREWGFHCPQGWRRWQDFVADGNKGKIGKGCDD